MASFISETMVNIWKANSVRYYCTYKEVIFGSEARERMLAGVETIMRAVGATMGPKGRSVIVERGKKVSVTRDGARVAKSIRLEDDLADVGARMIQGIAKSTATSVGQGTTTATVLAATFAKEGFKQISLGASPLDIQKGIFIAIDWVNGELKKRSRKISTRKELENVITSASNDPSIAKLVADSMDLVGWDGQICVTKGKRDRDLIEIIPGFRLKTTCPSECKIDVPANLNECLLLMSLKPLKKAADVVTALDLSFFKKQPLIILAQNVENEALRTILLNRLKLHLPVWAMKTSEEENIDILRDLVIASGGTLFGDDNCTTSIADLGTDDFGRAGEVSLSKTHTTILKCKGKPKLIEERAKMLKEEFDSAPTRVDKERLGTRLSQLLKGIAMIHIAHQPEVEGNEKMERVEGAVKAAQAASDIGISPGGGIAYIKAARVLKSLSPTASDVKKGIEIVERALKVPCTVMLNNAGKEANDIITKISQSDGDIGYDIQKDEFVNMFDSGIVDPTKVLMNALTNAGGAASLLTTAEAVIVNKDDSGQVFKK